MEKIDSKFIESLRSDVTDFLFTLVSTPSIANNETAACDYCYGMLEKIPGLKLQKLFMDNAMKENQKWCSGPYPHGGYNGQFDIEATWEGIGGQEPIYFNAHIDTVEPCDPSLMPPQIVDDILYGLGAVDDKGQIAVIYAMLRYLSAFNIRFPFDVVMHIVVEEEIGGNGSMAITDRPLKGQAAVVMEATGGVVNHAARGGLWLKLICTGTSSHPGSFQTSGRPRSAYDLLVKAITVVSELHNNFCKKWLENPIRYFEGYTPPFNLGMVHAGNWPSTVPTEAYAGMLYATLPSITHSEMRKCIDNAIDSDPDLHGNCRVEYIFDRESSITESSDPMIGELVSCLRDKGYEGKIDTMKCVDDTYFYRNVLHFPTVTLGAGVIVNAHSKNEQISLSETLRLADVLLNWLCLRGSK